MTGFCLLKLISCPSVQYCHSATVTTFKTFIGGYPVLEITALPFWMASLITYSTMSVG